MGIISGIYQHFISDRIKGRQSLEKKLKSYSSDVEVIVACVAPLCGRLLIGGLQKLDVRRSVWGLSDCFHWTPRSRSRLFRRACSFLGNPHTSSHIAAESGFPNPASSRSELSKRISFFGKFWKRKNVLCPLDASFSSLNCQSASKAGSSELSPVSSRL